MNNHIDIPEQFPVVDDEGAWAIMSFTARPGLPATEAWELMSNFERTEALLRRDWKLTFFRVLPTDGPSVLVSLNTRSMSPYGKLGTQAVYAFKNTDFLPVRWFDNSTGEIIA